MEADFIKGETLRADTSPEELHFLIERFPEILVCEMMTARVANALRKEQETRRKPD